MKATTGRIREIRIDRGRRYVGVIADGCGPRLR